MAWLSRAQINDMGFGHVADSAFISDKASFHNCAAIHVGARSRIDDFCVLSAGAGGIHIGRNVHLAVFCSLMGGGTIHLDDFANLSSRVAVYASSDDFSGATLTNPTVPSAFTGVVSAPVKVGRHVVVGAGTVLLPGVTLGDGVAVGALSLVKTDCEPFSIHAGCPARRVGQRHTTLLALEQAYLASLG